MMGHPPFKDQHSWRRWLYRAVAGAGTVGVAACGYSWWTGVTSAGAAPGSTTWISSEQAPRASRTAAEMMAASIQHGPPDAPQCLPIDSLTDLMDWRPPTLHNSSVTANATGTAVLVLPATPCTQNRGASVAPGLGTNASHMGSAGTRMDDEFCQNYNSPLERPLPSVKSGTASNPCLHLLPALSPCHSLQPVPRSASISSICSSVNSASTAASGRTGSNRVPASSPVCGRVSGKRPRLLVCHDMRNNYSEDRLTQGSTDAGFYALNQWEAIDVFVYFSHHFCTIPTPGWIAAAHCHGVQVLGTLITEWGDGAILCAKMLATEESARAVADKLVAIAIYFGFEGWLLNIENCLPRRLLPNLIHFVSYLRARLHAEIPNALLIWYDAVTVNGKLQHQNALTSQNRPLFDATDGLFINYSWRQGTPAEVAAAAGGRAADVFMGVDVFGRGSYGGGQDNCDVALAAARAAGLSAALFGPGWVYENFPRQAYPAKQYEFWTKVAHVWSSRPIASAMPFSSSFDLGFGQSVWIQGRQVSVLPWFNMACQEPQPLCGVAHGADCSALPSSNINSGGAQSIENGPQTSGVYVTNQHGYSGGACVAVETACAGSSGAADSLVLHCLYTANIPVPPCGLDIAYVTAQLRRGSSLALALWFHSSSGGAQHQRQRHHSACLPELVGNTCSTGGGAGGAGGTMTLVAVVAPDPWQPTVPYSGQSSRPDLTAAGTMQQHHSAPSSPLSKVQRKNKEGSCCSDGDMLTSSGTANASCGSAYQAREPAMSAGLLHKLEADGVFCVPCSVHEAGTRANLPTSSSFWLDRLHALNSGVSDAKAQRADGGCTGNGMIVTKALPALLQPPPASLLLPTASGTSVQPAWRLCKAHISREAAPGDVLVGIGLVHWQAPDASTRPGPASLLGHIAICEHGRVERPLPVLPVGTVWCDHVHWTPVIPAPRANPSPVADVTANRHAPSQAHGNVAWAVTCDLHWMPAFDAFGHPHHRQYHVWASFDPPTEAGISPPQPPSGCSRSLRHPSNHEQAQQLGLSGLCNNRGGRHASPPPCHQVHLQPLSRSSSIENYGHVRYDALADDQRLSCYASGTLGSAAVARGLTGQLSRLDRTASTCELAGSDIEDAQHMAAYLRSLTTRGSDPSAEAAAAAVVAERLAAGNASVVKTAIAAAAATATAALADVANGLPSAEKRAAEEQSKALEREAAKQARWLGRTHVNAFRVLRLQVPCGCRSVTFLVQAVGRHGEVQPIQSAAVRGTGPRPLSMDLNPALRLSNPVSMPEDKPR